MNDIDRIILFAKSKKTTDVSSHAGAYQTIIDYCETLKSDDFKEICIMCHEEKMLKSDNLCETCYDSLPD